MTDVVSKFIDPLATDRSPLDKNPPAAKQTKFEQVLNAFFTQETSAQVQETLRQMQIPEPKNYNEYLRGTDGLIIFDNARGVVIRIEKEAGYMDSSRANDSAWMIQPLASVKTATGSATVEIVPGVHFEKNDAESRKLYWKLASDGYDFWDERLDNVGRLPLKNVQFPEGVPVVIDRLAARPLESTHLLNRALPLTVFPWLLEGHRSPVHKNDLHFWDIIAEQKQMISEGARKAASYVIPVSQVPAPDPQEVLYGDLKKSFREAWPEGAAEADPQKIKDFWEKTAQAKTEGRLVAGWNEDTYEGIMSKPKVAPDRAAAYEKRLNAAGIFDIDKTAPLRAAPAESLQAKAGKTTGRADIALSLAEGNYGMAGVAAGQQLVLNEKAMAGAAKLAIDIAPVAKGLGFFAKKIPVIGAAVTAGYVLYEVGDNTLRGEYGRAGAALIAGAAETAGNIVGFGVGDGAREATRSGIIAAAGEEYAPMKSGLRTLGERGTDYLGKFIGDDTPEKIAQKQKDLIENDPVLPKTAKISGRDLPLTEALREETFRKNFREALVRANGKDGLALETQLKNLETFETLEGTRRKLAQKALPVAEKRSPSHQIADQQVP